MFFAIAFGWSWTVAAVLWATGGIAAPARHTAGGFLFMLGPAIAALVLTRDRQVLGLKLPFNRWLGAAWLIPAVAVIVALSASVLVPGTRFVSAVDALAGQLPQEQLDKIARLPKGAFESLLMVQAFLLGPTLNVPFMLSEELGWRGWLWSRWQPRLGFWRNALFTGAVWGVWHAPLILMGHNYPDTPRLGVLLMVVFCVLLAPLIAFVREKGGTVWHACLFHGTINGAASLGGVILLTQGWMGRGIVGLPGFLVLGAMVLVLWLGKRRAQA